MQQVHFGQPGFSRLKALQALSAKTGLLLVLFLQVCPRQRFLWGLELPDSVIFYGVPFGLSRPNAPAQPSDRAPTFRIKKLQR